MEKQKLYIWDNPESKLRFLDMVMRGQRWEASVIIPNEMRDDARVDELKQYLRDNGYSVSREKDIYRNDVLNVTHLGSSAGLFEQLHHHGLIKGTANTIHDMGSALSRALISGKQYTQDVAGNSARVIGAVYLLGDILVTASAGFNKQTVGTTQNQSWLKRQLNESKDLYNQLQFTQGASTLLQSLIYLQYARDGQDVLLSDLEHQLKKSEKTDRNPLDTSAWLEEQSKRGFMTQADSFLRKNAITIGGLTLIGGQFAFIAGGMMRIKKWQKNIQDYHHGTLGADVLKQLDGFMEKKSLSVEEKLIKKRNAGYWELGRGGFSTAAWSTFILDPVHTENKADWKEHPLLRLKQEALENPQRPAAMLSAVSSGFGAWAGNDKGNPVQKTGELTYLFADAVMFVTKKHDYGKINASLDEQKIEATTHLIINAPFAIGASERVEFITNVVRYMIAQSDKDNDTQTEEPEQRTKMIVEGVLKGLLNQETAFERVTSQAATLIDQLPRDSQEAIITKLSKTLSQLDNIYATADEIETSIRAQHIERSYGPDATFDMARVIPDMVSLIYAIPGLQSADNAIAIYELFERTYKLAPEEREQLQDEMQHVAEQAIAAHSGKETPNAQIHAAQLQSTQHRCAAAIQ